MMKKMIMINNQQAYDYNVDDDDDDDDNDDSSLTALSSSINCIMIIIRPLLVLL